MNKEEVREVLVIMLIVSIVYLILFIDLNRYFVSSKETGDELVRLISGSWEDCDLAIGVDDNQLYWKCHGFASKIGYECKKSA